MADSQASTLARFDRALRPVGSSLREVDRLLRDVSGTLDRIESGQGLSGFARAMILTAATSTGVFGAAMGSFRGGLQIPSAAIKKGVM